MVSALKSKNTSGPGSAPPAQVELAKGGLFSALAAIAVASMAAIVKWGSNGFSTEFLVATSFGAGLLAFMVISLMRRQAFLYRASHPIRCSLVAASWVGGIFCCYFAIRFIPLTDAVLLVYTAPLFASAAEPPLPKENRTSLGLGGHRPGFCRGGLRAAAGSRYPVKSMPSSA